MKLRNFVLLSIILAVFLIPSAALCQVVGKYTIIEGKVDVFKSGSSRAVPVKENDSVSEGDIIRTKSSSFAEITFKDESTVRIAQNSKLEITKYIISGKNKRESSILRLARGKIKATVSKAASKVTPVGAAGGSKFEVHTPSAVAGVRGTTFIVYHYMGITGVLFLTGEGYIFSNNLPGRIINISSGQFTIIDDPNSPPHDPYGFNNIDLNRHLRDTSPQGGRVDLTDEERDFINRLFAFLMGGGDNLGISQLFGFLEGYGATFGTYELPDYIDNYIDTGTGGGSSGGGSSVPSLSFTSTGGSVALGTGGSITSGGTLSGTIPSGGGTGSAAYSGGFSNPSNEHTLTGNISGTYGSGGSFVGYLGGTWFSWDAYMKGIYIEPNGTTGYLTSFLTGTEDISAFTGGGALTAVQMGVTAVPPADLAANLGTAVITSSISGSSYSPYYTINTNAADSGTRYFLPDQYWGIFSIPESGWYTGTPPQNWSAKAGGENSGYWIGDITGTSWLNNRFEGALQGSGLETMYKFTLSGNIIGAYDDNIYSPYYQTWNANTLGVVVSTTPLAFSGDFSADYYYYDSYSDYIDYSGDSISGIFGAVDNPFPAGSAISDVSKTVSMNLIGMNNPYSDYQYMTWWADISGNSYVNTASQWSGWMGGVTKLDNSMTGMLKALYIDSTGQAGILSGDFSGTYYPSINMWEGSGNLTAVAKKGAVEYNPALFSYYINTGYPDGYISGYFNSGPYSYPDNYINSGNTLQYIYYDSTETRWLASEPWGIFKFELGGYRSDPWPSTSEPFTMHLGGTEWKTYTTGDNDYWIAHISGNWYSNDTSFIEEGTVTGRYLTPYALGTISGNMLGSWPADSYSGGTWEAVAMGEFTETPLAFSGNIDYDYNGNGLYNNADGILGVGDTYGGLVGGTTSPWSGTTSLTLMGPYSYDPYYPAPYLWNAPIYSYNWNNSTYTTYDGGAFWGLTGGIWKGDGTIDAKVYSLYIDPLGNAGILKGSLTGAYYPELSMFEAEGTWTPTILATGFADPTILGSLTYDYDLNWWTYGLAGTGSFTADGTIFEDNKVGLKYSMPGTAAGEGWGVWQSLTEGSYLGTTSDTWNFSFNYTDSNSIIGTETLGTQWSNGVLKGQTLGYGADITNTPQTWISVGETIGTFDSNTATWQAVQTGAWLETNKFLAMASTIDGRTKLQQLNIPCVEVGRATLTGSSAEFTNLAMTDTIFFAPSTGAKPTIWATGNVSGNYTAPPTLPVALTGGPLSATFTFQTWDTASGKWLSTINGTGGYNGTTTFSGAGAGTGATSTSGSITGTAAGVAK